MSFANLDHVLQPNTKGNIPTVIAKILRDEYGESGAAIKRISNKIDIKQRTVKNWYEAKNTPNLGHFIKLVKASPKLVEYFLLRCGYEELAKIFTLKYQQENSPSTGHKIVLYSIIFDTDQNDLDIELLRKLNQRQLWFYSEIGLGNKPTAETLAKAWSISSSTAKRDIALLTNLKLIGFIGSRRNGFYISRNQ